MCFDRLAPMATMRNILGSLVATIAILAVMSLAIWPPMTELSGGLPILDTMITYNYNDVVALFTALGSEGRGLYSIQQIIDMIFPIMYSVTLTLALILLAPSPVRKRKWARIVVFLPLAGAAFDYAENILIATQIAAFPSLSEAIIGIAAFVTWTKWVLLSFSFVLLLIFLVPALSPTKDRE